MINNELYTPFRIYDDILKQNRYRENCLASCDYKLISTLSAILPFQFKIDVDGDFPTVEAVGFDVFCSYDDSLYADIDESALSIDITNNAIYISYFGGETVSLECGNYYIKITLNVAGVLTYFYSEIFTAILDYEPVSGIPYYNNFTLWRWYNSISKQNRYKSNCDASCDYYLISSQDSLIPFQFRIDISSPNTVDSFKLVAVDGSCEAILDTGLINKYTGTDYDYFYYSGDPIADLPCGNFYGVVTINGVDYFSELIKITPIDTVDMPGDYILQETGFNILQETGYGLLQE